MLKSATNAQESSELDYIFEKMGKGISSVSAMI